MSAEDLFEKYFQNALSPSEVEELKTRLRESPEAEREFARYAEERGILVHHSRRRKEEDTLRLATTREPAHSRLPAAVLVAASVLVGIGITLAVRPGQVPSPTPEVAPGASPPPPQKAFAREFSEPGEAQIKIRERVEPAERKPSDEPGERRAPVDPEKPPVVTAQVEKAPKPQEEKPAESAEKNEPAPRPPPGVKETLPAVAQLAEILGEVYVISRGERRRVEGKTPLARGDSVETVGGWSAATVQFKDSTSLLLWNDTTVRDLADVSAVPAGKERGGKGLFLARGTLWAEVVRQPAGQPLVLSTSHGEARVLGTLFKVVVDPEGKAKGMLLEVDEGKVELKRGGRSAVVPGGQYAVAAEGMDLVARPMQQDTRKSKPPQQPLPPAVQRAVDEAVKKGAEWLKEASRGYLKDLVEHHGGKGEELLLLTFVHAGVPVTDPHFDTLFKSMMGRDLQHTYNVSLQAMILEAMNPVKYRWRLEQCAQFLADNQCKNGDWSYGKPSPSARSMPTGDAKPEIAARLTPAQREKLLKKLTIRKAREGPDQGDPSNSQYAALGLRACHDAAIHFSPELIQRAQRSWVQRQAKDGSWEYPGNPPSGTMTTGGLGSLCIYHHMLREPWMGDPAVRAGMEWLTKNFSVSSTPGAGSAGGEFSFWYFYYMYGLERAGTLYGTETIGSHKWYPEGVKVLLENQQPDGRWQGKGSQSGWDTCWAILFLKHATRPLTDVASVDRFNK